MLKLRRPLRVALVGLTAAATTAVGVVALVASPAQAAGATTLTIQAVYPTDLSASAGTCQIYRALPTDFAGNPASDSGTVIISVTESPSSSTQDVDFCTPPAAPDGQSGVRPTTATYNLGAQEYNLGKSVSTSDDETPGAADEPDTASMTPAIGPSVPRNNPEGYDEASASYTAGQFIEFGVSGLIPGQFTIDAYIDRTTDIPAPQRTVTLTDGGKPQSSAVYDAVTSISSERTQYAAVKSTGTAATIDTLLRNKGNDTVFDVTPSVRVQNGPNASSLITSCTPSTNFGESRCTYLGQQPGTDSLLIWINQSAKPNSTATPGPDAGEPTLAVTVTTYDSPSPAASARFVDLTPDTPTTQAAGTSKIFTATVTDSSGAPVQGARVTFDETGPGKFDGVMSPDGVTSTKSGLSGPDGRIPVTSVARDGESGNQVVTARLSSADTQCGQLFNGQTGRCSDSTTNTISVAASPSPTTTATASPTAKPTASATPTATISPSASPTSTPGQCSVTPTVNLQPTTINATGSGGVTVSGPAGRQIELFAYSQPSTTYRVVRTGTLGSNGTISFTVRPPTNTRLYAQIVGCDTDDVRFSRVLNVRTTLSLFVARNGKQDYTFSGDSLPARPGGLIVSLYRFTSSGSRVLTAQARANSSTGDWVIRRVFTGTGRFDFQVRTGQDLQNAPGASNIRSLLIF